MDIAIVFNPGSGARTATHTLHAVTTALQKRRHKLHVINSLSNPNFEQWLQTRAQDFERTIVIGGDGTLNGAVNGIMTSLNPLLPVAFVPAGRGKDSARTLASWNHKQLDYDDFEATTPLKTDVIRLQLSSGQTRYCINVASMGLASHAASIANRLPRRMGTLSYVVGAARAMVPTKPFNVSLTIDGNLVEVDGALLLSMCNGRAVGGGMYVAPEASPCDGLIDIVVVRKAHLGDLARQLPRLKSGQPFEHKALMRWRGSHIDVQPVESSWYDADGELLASQPVRISVVPGALNWIGPQ